MSSHRPSRKDVESLCSAGVRDVWVSPGSRSTPFTWAAQHTPGLVLRPVIDERSAAFLALGRKLSSVEYTVAAFGLMVGIAMALMKILPWVPGSFTVYEWIALTVWVAVGMAVARKAAVHRSAAATGTETP